MKKLIAMLLAIIAVFSFNVSALADCKPTVGAAISQTIITARKVSAMRMRCKSELGKGKFGMVYGSKARNRTYWYVQDSAFVSLVIKSAGLTTSNNLSIDEIFDLTRFSPVAKDGSVLFRVSATGKLYHVGIYMDGYQYHFKTGGGVVKEKYVAKQWDRIRVLRGL